MLVHAGLGHQPARDGRMGHPSITLGHGVIGHLLQDLVLEGVLAQVARVCIRPWQHQFTPQQRGQCLRRQGVQGDQCVVPKNLADDAGALQRVAFSRRQAVQPGLQHADQGGRHRRRHQPGGVQGPVVGAGVDRPQVDQHLDQLLHVEGVAFGPTGDQFAQGLGGAVQPLQQLVGQCQPVGGAERCHVDPALCTVRELPGQRAREQGWPGEAEHQQGHVVIDIGQVVQKAQGLVVGPVQVLCAKRPSGFGWGLRRGEFWCWASARPGIAPHSGRQRRMAPKPAPTLRVEAGNGLIRGCKCAPSHQAWQPLNSANLAPSSSSPGRLLRGTTVQQTPAQRDHR